MRQQLCKQDPRARAAVETRTCFATSSLVDCQGARGLVRDGDRVITAFLAMAERLPEAGAPRDHGSRLCSRGTRPTTATTTATATTSSTATTSTAGKTSSSVNAASSSGGGVGSSSSVIYMPRCVHHSEVTSDAGESLPAAGPLPGPGALPGAERRHDRAAGGGGGGGGGGGTGDVGEEGTEDPELPYPALAPVAFFVMKQSTMPRSWCLRMA
ncbi:unnamed protein product [Lampetra fluviatilis]